MAEPTHIDSSHAPPTPVDPTPAPTTLTTPTPATQTPTITPATTTQSDPLPKPGDAPVRKAMLRWNEARKLMLLRQV